MVEYDFTKGLYRAFVRTGYKNGNNEIQSIDGNKYPFESNYVSPVPIITDVTVDTTNKTVTFTWASDSSPDQIHIYLDTGDPYWEHMTCTSPYTINSQQIQDGSYYVIIVSGNGVPSAPYYFSVDFNLYVFSTNPDIKINSVTLEVPNASLSRTAQAYGLMYKLYSNGLLVISGAMTSYRSDPYHDLNNIYYDSLYIYFAGSNVYYENLFGVSFYNVKEIAYYSKSYGTAGTSAADMFENCQSLLNIDFGNSFSTYGVTDMSEMFMACKLTTLDLSKAAMFSTLQVTNMIDMFRSCTRLTSINFGQFFSTFNVTMTADMFYNCQSLTSLDLSGWSSLYSLHHADNMFYNCISLESINLGTISIFSTTSGYYSMSEMFKNCRSLTSLDVSGFRVQYVTSAREAFANCSSLVSLDLSSWRPTQAYLGDEGLIDGCTALEVFTAFAPRQSITLPKKMYDKNGTEYTKIPYTSSSSSSQRITVYATNPTVNTNNLLSLRSVPANLLRAVSENRNVEYDFTEGLYRAYVRTTYKNGYNIENYTISNRYPFNSTKEPSYIEPIINASYDGSANMLICSWNSGECADAIFYHDILEIYDNEDNLVWTLYIDEINKYLNTPYMLSISSISLDDGDYYVKVQTVFNNRTLNSNSYDFTVSSSSVPSINEHISARVTANVSLVTVGYRDEFTDEHISVNVSASVTLINKDDIQGG